MGPYGTYAILTGKHPIPSTSTLQPARLSLMLYVKRVTSAAVLQRQQQRFSVQLAFIFK